MIDNKRGNDVRQTKPHPQPFAFLVSQASRTATYGSPKREGSSYSLKWREEFWSYLGVVMILIIKYKMICVISRHDVMAHVARTNCMHFANERMAYAIVSR